MLRRRVHGTVSVGLRSLRFDHHQVWCARAPLAGPAAVVDVRARASFACQRVRCVQREFKDTFSPAHTIRLSSAGLIYRHYGHEAIAHILDLPKEDPRLAVLYTKIYEVGAGTATRARAPRTGVARLRS